MVQIIELRIHAGAPSARHDDDRYRALASGYIGFTGQRQPSVAPGSPHDYDAHIAEAVLIPATVLRPRHIGPVDDSTVFPANADDATFIENTQLAFDALESQIFTSSLTAPEVTLVPRTSSDNHQEEGDVSRWPEDLEAQSQLRQVPIPDDPRVPSSASGVAVEHEEGADAAHALREASSSPGPRHASEQPALETHNNDHSAGFPNASTASMGFGRHRFLVGNDFGAAVTKSFKLPLKRTVSETVLLPIVEAPEVLSPRAQSQQSDRAASSYLRTPILDGSRKRSRRAQDDDMPMAKHLKRATARRVFSDAQAEEAVSTTSVTNYREQTPLGAYIVYSEEARIGLAFIGGRQEGTNSRPENGQEDSKRCENSVDMTSELPTTYSLTSSTASKRTPLRPPSQRSISDPGSSKRSNEPSSHSESNQSNSQPAQAIVSPLSVQQTQNGPGKHGGDPTRDEEKSPALIPQVKITSKPAQHVRSPAGNSIEPAALSPSPTETGILKTLADMAQTIRPPQPLVSIETYSTHITESLAQLATDSRLKYNPIQVTRKVRPLERGYWLIRTTAIPAQLQLDSWRWLEKYVGSGKAGWGVWCTRINQADCTDPMGASDALVGDMKIFCWGEVIRHVYLLLYVASSSQVRKLGLQWIDAEGQVVVQMRSKP